MAAASAPAPRRSARARRPPERLADSAEASASARRRTTRPRRPLLRRSARGPVSQTVFPDEILEEIFLRLDAAADLVRASAACFSFRRIISERRFLLRFRSLRSPAVLGFTNGEMYAAVDPPHRTAPEARALEESTDFSFSFIPGGVGAGGFRHARDGRVLFASPETELADYVVCDPLYRRYVRIPRIPDDLLASTAYNGFSNHVFPILGAGENDEEGESFRIFCTVQLSGKVVVLIFSSCNQSWRAIISTIRLPHRGLLRMPDYVHGCVHWMLDCPGYSLMLDTSDTEFSIIDLPPTGEHLSNPERAIVETEEGRLGFVTIGDDSIELYCKDWPKNGVSAQDWQHKKLIPLPKDPRIDYGWYFEGTAGHYIAVLASYGMDSKYYVLDIKTLLLEELFAP